MSRAAETDETPGYTVERAERATRVRAMLARWASGAPDDDPPWELADLSSLDLAGDVPPASK